MYPKQPTFLLFGPADPRHYSTQSRVYCIYTIIIERKGLYVGRKCIRHYSQDLENSLMDINCLFITRRHFFPPLLHYLYKYYNYFPCYVGNAVLIWNLMNSYYGGVNIILRWYLQGRSRGQKQCQHFMYIEWSLRTFCIVLSDITF